MLWNFKLLTQKLENKEKYIFNLQLIKEDILILEKGYKHELTDKQNKFINIINQSDTLIFIYPLYWLNMPMLLKGFIDMTFGLMRLLVSKINNIIKRFMER